MNGLHIALKQVTKIKANPYLTESIEVPRCEIIVQMT